MTVGIRRLYDGRVAENLHTQNEMFARVEYAWNSNPIGVHFHTTFMRLPFPPYINKIVCIGLGNFVLRADFKRDPNMQLSLYRHLAVLAAVEVLYSRFGRQIQILAQDVNYSPDCAAFLFKKGFSIVGPYGAGGLAEIDDKTFVFSPNPDFCAKEVVADIARPAAMLWKQILTPEESERQTRFDKPTGFGDQIAAYWNYDILDPDTPRVRALAKSYDVYPFPFTNVFGDVAIYTRKRMSLNYAEHKEGTTFNLRTPVPMVL
ncbi:hypothetical protein PC116_g29866 [Phytophthora cactorum]|nr:hypothetical protein PC116_g29866 [Phytophthora cactorum]